MFRWKSLAFFALAVALMTGVSTAPGQISVSIGVEPVCPYGYFDYAPYDCAPYGYYGPDFFVGGLFIGAGPGSMDPEASPVTSITATILATVTKDRCPRAERRRSATSSRTKLGMGEATSFLMPATTRTRSTAPDIRRENPAADTVKEWFNEVNGEPHFVETASWRRSTGSARRLLRDRNYCGSDAGAQRRSQTAENYEHGLLRNDDVRTGPGTILLT